jgi:hypothetical protein
MAGVAALGLTALTYLASRFTAPIPAPPGARLLPRVPRPPANVGEVLRMLGLGSLVWYASFVSAPLFVWTARRLPLDRRHWLASVAANLSLIVGLTVLTAWAQFELTFHGVTSPPPIGGYLRFGLITGMLPFLAVDAVAHAAVAVSRAHDREVDSNAIGRVPAGGANRAVATALSVQHATRHLDADSTRSGGSRHDADEPE